MSFMMQFAISSSFLANVCGKVNGYWRQFVYGHVCCCCCYCGCCDDLSAAPAATGNCLKMPNAPPNNNSNNNSAQRSNDTETQQHFPFSSFRLQFWPVISLLVMHFAHTHTPAHTPAHSHSKKKQQQKQQLQLENRRS